MQTPLEINSSVRYFDNLPYAVTNKNMAKAEMHFPLDIH